MNYFLESPVPTVLLGIAFLTVAVLFYLQTRSRIAFASVVLVALLTILGVVAERMIVTEKEEVEEVIYGLAAAGEANDINGVLAYLSPKATHIRRLVQQYMPDSKVEKVRFLGAVTISVDLKQEPQTANVTGTVFVSGKWTKDKMYAPQKAKAKIFLVKQGKKWMITKFTGIDDK